MSRPGAAQEAQYGASGVTFQGPPQTHLAIFELTEDMTYPDLQNAPDDHFDRQPTPFAKAKMVWCWQQSTEDVDAEGNPICTYGGTEFSQEVVVWHPAAPCNSDGYAYGTPTFATGDRVYCQWNRQSGRWEIEAPALNIWRVELQGTLMPTQCQVQAVPSDAPSQSPITVYRPDGYLGGFGVGRAGQEAPGTQPGPLQHGGTHAYVIWSPVRQQWEFLSDQFKLLAEATAYDDLPPGSKGRVNLWWLDYPSGELVDSGQQVLAENWFHPDIKCGEKVIVSYDRQEDRWTILAADFTTRYQNLDVVTGVTLSINFQTQIYTLHYTTQQIQLPPWVTIGDPVQH